MLWKKNTKAGEVYLCLISKTVETLLIAIADDFWVILYTDINFTWNYKSIRFCKHGDQNHIHSNN